MQGTIPAVVLCAALAMHWRVEAQTTRPTSVTRTTLSNALPATIVLSTDVFTGLYKDGKVTGSVRLRAGQVLNVTSYDKRQFLVSVEGGEARIEAKTTELARTNSALIEQLTEIWKQAVFTSQLATNPVSVPGTVEWYYYKAKTALAYNEINLPQHLGADRVDLNTLTKAQKEVVEAYEAGDKAAAFTAGTNWWLTVRPGIYSRQDHAYRESDPSGRLFSVPLNLEVASDGSAIELRFGEGNRADRVEFLIDEEDLRRFDEVVGRIDAWVKACRLEKIDARKQAGVVGRVEIAFVSFDEGRQYYVEVRFRSYVEDRFESRTYRLVPLNFWRLQYQYSEFPQKARKWLRNKAAADRLR